MHSNTQQASFTTIRPISATSQGHRPKPLFAVVNGSQTFEREETKARDASSSPLKRFHRCIRSFVSKSLGNQVLALPAFEPVVRAAFVSRDQMKMFYEVFYIFEDPRCITIIKAVDKQLREQRTILAFGKMFYEYNPGPMPVQSHVEVSSTDLGKIFRQLSQNDERLERPAITTSNNNSRTVPASPIKVGSLPSTNQSSRSIDSETVHFALIVAMHVIRTEQLNEAEQGIPYQRRLWSYIQDICPEHHRLFNSSTLTALRLDSRMVRVSANSFREAFFIRSLRSDPASQKQVIQLSQALHSSHELLKKRGIIYSSDPGEFPRMRYYVPPEDIMRQIRLVPAQRIPDTLIVSSSTHQSTVKSSPATTSTTSPSGAHRKVESIIELSSDEEAPSVEKTSIERKFTPRQTSKFTAGIGSRNTPITLSDDDEASDATKSTTMQSVKEGMRTVGDTLSTKVHKPTQNTQNRLKPATGTAILKEVVPMLVDEPQVLPAANTSRTISGVPSKQTITTNNYDTLMQDERPPEFSRHLSDEEDINNGTILSREDAAINDAARAAPSLIAIPGDLDIDDLMDESVPASPSIGDFSEPQTDIENEPLHSNEVVIDHPKQCSDWATAMATSMSPSEAKRYLDKARKYPRDPTDTSFSDMMRDLPQSYLQATSNRLIFESWILQKTSGEPDAPPIGVKNTVDDEPCPSWDFTYINKLIHGDGVPKPLTPEEQEGCSCRGGCRPDIDACSCARRQREYTGEFVESCFLYDAQGRYIDNRQLPIFECNDGCSCAAYCSNRVAQNGRKYAIEIRKTANRGWGVFAVEPIPMGTYIGIYAGELLLDEEAEVRGRDLYNQYDRNYLFNVDFWYMKEDRKRKGKPQTSYVIDAMHAGSFTRYLNHSCDPNSQIIPCVFGGARADMPYLAFFTRRYVQEDEEITFSYKGDIEEPTEEEQAAARKRAEAKRLLEKGRPKDTGTEVEKFKVDVRCQCGSYNCNGSIWNWASDDGGSEDGSDD
ncbi:hypothetical protein FRC19_003531 [Serendipita sp. 401]|nr:hypothetical protein FRC19_003531 [Serendipita sp. 401]KAG9057881.1 hypothetical protein FS842_003201 [Serendipita sp. 407]